MTDLFIKVKSHQEQQLPFVLFCKPDSDRIVGVFQKNDHLYFLENFEIFYIFNNFFNVILVFIIDFYTAKISFTGH